jgi:hypothetical protein
MVCNPNSAVNWVSLSYVDSTGETLYSKDYSVQGNGSLQCELSELVQGASYENGSVEISSNKGVAAFALYKNTKTNAYCYAGISAIELVGATEEESQGFSGATLNDFAGTWQGTLSYTFGAEGDPESQSGEAETNLTLAVNGDSLEGTFLKYNELLDISGTVVDGVFTFKIPPGEPENPDCQAQDVTATAMLDESLIEMDISISGSFCASVDEYPNGRPGNMEGTLSKN